MQKRVKKAAEEAGLPFGERLKTYNSRLAQELGKWAESNNKGDSFHHAVFRAYFAEGKNIAKISELVNIADSAGLPRDASEAILIKRTFKAEVDGDWLLSQKNGITAVPTFVMNKDRLAGAQPYDMLERLMKANNVKKRTGL